MKLLVLLALILINGNSYGRINRDVFHNDNDNDNMVIKIEFAPGFQADSFSIGLEKMSFVIKSSFENKPVELDVHKAASWKLYSNTPLLIDLSNVPAVNYSFCILEPGDSVIIRHGVNNAEFKGKGAEKIRLISEFIKEKGQIAKPENVNFLDIKSVNDLKTCNQYWDRQELLLDRKFDGYTSTISDSILNYLKANFVADIEYERLLSFSIFVRNASKSSLPMDSVSMLYDNYLNHKNAVWLRSYTGRIRSSHYFYYYIRQTILKEHGFDWNDPFMKSVDRKVAYFQLANQLYKGYPLMSCLTYLLTTSGLKDHVLKGGGYSLEIDSLLNIFYKIPGFQEYKDYVRSYEKKIGNKLTLKGTDTYDFTLRDKTGKEFKKGDFEGKVMLISFGKTGCKDCVDMDRSISNIQKHFRNDSNVMFIKISVTNVERSGVIKDAAKSMKNELYLFTDSYNDPVVKGYNIKKFPELFLIDATGKSVFNPDTDEYNNAELKLTKLPDPRLDNGKALIASIKQQIQFINDGPYVFCDPQMQIVYPHPKTAVDNCDGRNRKGCSFKVSTDVYNTTFNVTLHEIQEESTAIYNMPEKMIVLSDIEGNFSALRSLLAVNKVIDSAYNWIFGKGHLIFNGDMFDRGKQVTECLWLLYFLEEQARLAGGQIHFVLGNHEVMNLYNDTRYNDKKYDRIKTITGRSQSELYGINTELGKWLRSKNIIEKIGSYLFVHGGVSPEINKMNLPLDSINVLFKRYLLQVDNTCNESTEASVILNAKTSPYWFRGYYSNVNDSSEVEKLVTNTLINFNVSRIITGHTIVSDKISSLYNGKVINVDTRHAKGKSEALLITGNRLYRVDRNGNKTELLTTSMTE